MRTYVALLHEYLEEMEELTDEEFGRLCRGLLRYSATGEVFEPMGNERFYLRHVMAQEDRHQESYDALAQKRREAGRLGAEARWGGHGKMANDSKNGNTKTKTETKTKTKTKTNSLSSEDEKRREERMRKDILEVELFCREKGGEMF